MANELVKLHLIQMYAQKWTQEEEAEEEEENMVMSKWTSGISGWFSANVMHTYL